MLISWYGQSFFEIRFKDIKKQEFILVIDPFDESLGLKIPKIKADILLITHSQKDHNYIKSAQDNPFLIAEPGEYEVKEALIKGISSFYDNSEDKDKEMKDKEMNVIYKIEAEGIKICHLGVLNQKELNEQQLDEIGNVDLLMIPIGGIYTIDAKKAAGIISQIEPKIVIPMHYKIPKLKSNIEGVEKFLKIMGNEDIEPQKKLKIAQNQKDLFKEETKIVLLEPN